MLLLERIISVVAPHNCLICGAEGDLVCNWCQNDAFVGMPSRCFRCLVAATNHEVCTKCHKISRLRHVWVRTAYEANAKNLIAKLKFQRAPAAATTAAQFMKETIPYLPKDTLVLPVPTASSRRRQRGYDQAVLLARELARELHLPTQKCLARLGQSRQVGTSRKLRLSQLEQAFRVTDCRAVKGECVLLVDDVITTGATLEAAASVLKKAGAKQVDAVVFAQTALS